MEIITPQPKPVLPENILSNVRRLDEEIHRLAHGIEECIMAQRKHPADRGIDLDALRAEFLYGPLDGSIKLQSIARLLDIIKVPTNIIEN